MSLEHSVLDVLELFIKNESAFFILLSFPWRPSHHLFNPPNVDSLGARHRMNFSTLMHVVPAEAYIGGLITMRHILEG
ncbi:hypothetical protein VNO77_15396 [Canavalia gladiata]|uniref:Uncharacterized protein n=1 Tax=Canavalia gladiata TaxID=3824 RepID=A0AAN9QVU6_CANGL